MTQTREQEIAGRLRVSRIIHAVFVASLVTYAILVHLLLAVVGWKALLSEAAAAPVRLAFYGLGSVAFVGMLFLKPRLISAEVLVSVARQRGAEAALALLHARLVTFLATSEVPAVLGLLLFLLGGVLSDFYALWAASLVGHLILTPRRELWEAVARAGARA
jgi:hypothetical protein